MPAWTPPDPYVGPVAFGRGDRWRFFGRADVTDEAASRLLSSRAMLLYGQSGAGKTSLVNAALLPLVEEDEHFDVLPTGRVQGVLPAGTAPASLGNPYTHFLMASWQPTGGDQRPEGTLVEMLRRRPRTTDPFGDRAPRLIVIDQFEELFTAFPDQWPQRSRFVGELADALADDPRLHVLMCVREDHLAHVLGLAHLFPDRLRSRFRLPRLGRAEALEAVRRPAAIAGVPFAPGVAERLVDDLLAERAETAPGVVVDVAGEHVEAVQLQVVCSSIWSSLGDSSEITVDVLRRSGDVTSALAGYYSKAVGIASSRTGVEAARIHTWFETALITSGGTRAMVYRGAQSTAGLPNATVDELENLHMIRAEVRAGARWYELTHDRFITPVVSLRAAGDDIAERRWGFPLLAAGVALFAGQLLFGSPGMLAVLLRFAAGAMGAIGLAQLAVAAVARRARRMARERGTAAPLPFPRRTPIRIVTAVLGALALGGSLVALGQQPEQSSSTNDVEFGTYVAGFDPTARVSGSPDCGASNLEVYTSQSADVRTGTVEVQSGSRLTLPVLARRWCIGRAAYQMVLAPIMASAGLFLLIVAAIPLPDRIRRIAGRNDKSDVAGAPFGA